MTYLLGLHTGINASAAVGTLDGTVVFAVQEERLRREKNFIGFPRLSIAECLTFAGASRDDITTPRRWPHSMIWPTGIHWPSWSEHPHRMPVHDCRYRRYGRR